MKETLKSTLENKWIQEITILLFSFVLFTMNDWMLISSWGNLWKGCCYFMILYTHAQINRFFLLPILLKQHKPMLYVVTSVVLMLLFSFMLFEVSTLWLYKNCFLYKSIKQESFLFHAATIIATFICITGPLLLLRFYREQKQKAGETLLFNQMQLDSLRSQLNPHFLFNTFNTLYGISLQFPDQLPDLIMRVSQLMRYQLESTKKQFVSLADELSFIESYVGLEKERLGHRCAVEFSCSIANQDTYKISPMLLIAFVENAFKHGSGTIESGFVKILLSMHDAKLHMTVINSVSKRKQVVTSNKIGLENTIKQLDILYKNAYQINVDHSDSQYKLDLSIQLNML
jgi:two-component system, LytTR family, sensor kinase